MSQIDPPNEPQHEVVVSRVFTPEKWEEWESITKPDIRLTMRELVYGPPQPEPAEQPKRRKRGRK